MLARVIESSILQGNKAFGVFKTVTYIYHSVIPARAIPSEPLGHRVKIGLREYGLQKNQAKKAPEILKKKPEEFCK